MTVLSYFWRGLGIETCYLRVRVQRGRKVGVLNFLKSFLLHSELSLCRCFSRPFKDYLNEYLTAGSGPYFPKPILLCFCCAAEPADYAEGQDTLHIRSAEHLSHFAVYIKWTELKPLLSFFLNEFRVLLPLQLVEWVNQVMVSAWFYEHP
jgi:hypothetical protein